MAAIEKSANIDYWKQLKKFTSLASILSDIKEDRFIDKYYYKFSDGVYLQVSPFKGTDYKSSRESPYVTAVLFCENERSAQRVINMKIASDDNKYFKIPYGLWNVNYELTYSNAIRFFNEIKSAVIKESANYRVAEGGDFLHKTIETEKFKLFFRSQTIDKDEPPYAILLKLEE